MSQRKPISTKKTISDHSVLIFCPDKSDLTIVRQILRTLMVKTTYTSDTTADTLRLLNQHRPDILVLGLRQTSNDSLDFIRQIRVEEQSECRNVPLLAVMHTPTAREIQAARDAGVTEISVPPLSVKNFEDRLRVMLFRPRPFIEAEVFTGPDRRRKEKPKQADADRRMS